MRYILSVMLTIFLVGCTHLGVSQSQNEMHLCSSPRYELCTSHMPVCAERDTLIRCITTPCPAIELKTYADACSACSDPQVIGYRVGGCAAHQK